MKPFYIAYYKSMSDQDVADVFDKAVKGGAKLHEGVRNIHATVVLCKPSLWRFFGVNGNGECRFEASSFNFGYNAVRIKIDEVDAHLSAAMLPTYNAGGGYAINKGKSPVDDPVGESEDAQAKVVTAVTTTYSNMTNGKQYEVVKEDVCLGKYTVVNDDGFEVTLPNFQFSAW